MEGFVSEIVNLILVKVIPEEDANEIYREQSMQPCDFPINSNPQVENFLGSRIVTEIVDSLINMVVIEDVYGGNDDTKSTKSNSLYSYPECESLEDDQVTPGYDPPSKSISSDREVPGTVCEEFMESLNPPEDVELYDRTSEKSKEKSPKVNFENIVVESVDIKMHFEQPIKSTVKRKIEDSNDTNDIIYHAFSGLRMPKLLNRPPRLGLSKVRRFKAPVMKDSEH